MTEPCAHCGYLGTVAMEIFSYLVGGEMGSPVYRWFCGPETGRDCAKRYGK